MNLPGQLAYNAEETCRLVFMMVLDALGHIGNGSNSQIIGRLENNALEFVNLTCFHLT